MRWRDLFDDLEAQADALDDVELRHQIADRTRAELADVYLRRRLHSALGRAVDRRLLGEAAVRGVLAGWGSDWLLVEAADEVVVATGAVLASVGLQSHASATSAIGLVESRISLGAVVRAIARDRSAVTLRLIDGSQLVGTPDRVGADWIDLAAHDLGEAPRLSAVHGRWTVPLSAVAAIWRRPGGWE